MLDCADRVPVADTVKASAVNNKEAGSLFLIPVNLFPN